MSPLPVRAGKGATNGVAGDGGRRGRQAHAERPASTSRPLRLRCSVRYSKSFTPSIPPAPPFRATPAASHRRTARTSMRCPGSSRTAVASPRTHRAGPPEPPRSPSCGTDRGAPPRASAAASTRRSRPSRRCAKTPKGPCEPSRPVPRGCVCPALEASCGTWSRDDQTQASHRHPDLPHDSRGRLLLRRQDRLHPASPRRGHPLLPLAPAALRQEPVPRHLQGAVRGQRGAVRGARHS